MLPHAARVTSLEELLVGTALLLFLSIIASKASGRLGVPALILFVGIGVLAGSEGIGGIWFDDAHIAQRLGVVALAFILFAGGLETDWRFVRPSVRRAASLATIGVLVTAAIVGAFAHQLLAFTWPEAFLLGAIVSSTDAAAVFSIFRSRGVKLDEDVASTLELESGGNDPMAVFLTTAMLQLIASGEWHGWELLGHFVREMSLGAVGGLVFGLAAAWLLNRLKLEHGGLYPVFTLATVLISYGGTVLIGGNGFLSVYITGLAMGHRNFIQRRSLTRFHDGIAWLMQIVMFLALGLLVFPSRLVKVAGSSVLIALVLIFIARPVAVYISLATAKLNWREKALISWVGLRGAVPIVLATFPLLAGIAQAHVIFNIVFFVALGSVALQGTTIPFVARLLRLDVPSVADRSPSEEYLAQRSESSLVTLAVAADGKAAGRRVVDLRGWPREAMILVLHRGNEFFVPNGATELLPGDRVIVLTSRATIDTIRSIVEPSGRVAEE
jgi:cell volume regulation protein A